MDNEFEFISKLFFDKNFGQASKSQIELVMFYLYITNTENTTKSDFEIAKELGLIESRVSALRKKSHFVYANEYNIKDEFLTYLNEVIDEFTEETFVEKDGVTHISLSIFDSILQLELENYLNSSNLKFERWRNSRVIELTSKDFFNLLESIINDKEKFFNLKVVIDNKTVEKFSVTTMNAFKNLVGNLSLAEFVGIVGLILNNVRI